MATAGSTSSTRRARRIDCPTVACPDYQDVWILDVDGVRLMIGSRIGGDLDLDVPEKAVKAEIRQMVESIHFER